MWVGSLDVWYSDGGVVHWCMRGSSLCLLVCALAYALMMCVVGMVVCCSCACVDKIVFVAGCEQVGEGGEVCCGYAVVMCAVGMVVWCIGACVDHMDFVARCRQVT